MQLTENQCISIPVKSFRRNFESFRDPSENANKMAVDFISNVAKTNCPVLDTH